MERRDVLTAIGSGMAATTGCLDSNQPGNATSTSDPSSGPSNTGTTPQSGGMGIRISSVDDVPSDAPFMPSVKVVRSAVSPEQPARVQVTGKNTSNRTIWNSYVRVPAFGNFVSQNGPSGQRLLFLKRNEQHNVTHPGCWRVDLDKHALNSVHSDVVTGIRYGAGESKSTTLDMYGHPENADPCFALGEYRMENTYYISDTGDSADIQWEFQWGYMISIVEL